MNICILNGSPKSSKSTSELLIEYLMSFTGENETVTYNVCKSNLSEEQFSRIQSSDALVFVFPLYIDGINSQLLRFLIELEKRGFNNKSIGVYCIINNGFYEGRQNLIAADIIKNWCKAVGSFDKRTVSDCKSIFDSAQGFMTGQRFGQRAYQKAYRKEENA